MTSPQTEDYDLTGFDADDYWLETERATAGAYYFPNLEEGESGSTYAIALGAAVGDLLEAAASAGAVIEPFTIRDRSLVVVACRGYENVGISIIDATGDVARDVVTWVEPSHPVWVEQVLKVELLRNARESGIDLVLVRGGTTAAGIYAALGLHPVGVTA